MLSATLVAAEDQPDELTVPIPAVGDEASYWLLQATVDEEGDVTATTQPRLLNAFRVVEPRTVLTQDHGWMQALTVQQKQGHGPYPDQPMVDELTYHPEDGSMLTAGTHRLAVWSDQPDALSTDRHDVTGPARASTVGFCGIANHLQGERLPLDQPVALVDRCRLMTENWEVPTFEREAFHHAQTLTSDQGPIHVFEQSHGEFTVQAWFAEEVAYPVRFVYPYNTGPIGDTERHPRTYNVVSLRGYEAGTQPVEAGPLDDRATPADPELAEPEPWLLDDASLEHPFPLSQAFEVALDHDDGELEAFLADHPDTYPRSIKPRIILTENKTQHRWALELTDANASLHVSISQTIPHAEDEGDGGPYLPDPWKLTDDEEAGKEDERVQHEVSAHGPRPVEHPLPLENSLPAKLPTVASLVDAWSTAFQREPNTTRLSWELSVGGERLKGCEDPSCVEASLEIRVHEEGDDRRRSAQFASDGTRLGTQERWRIDDEAAYPDWVGFARDVRALDGGEQPPEPVLDGYEGLPEPPSEESSTLAGVLALAGVATGGLVGARSLGRS